MSYCGCTTEVLHIGSDDVRELLGHLAMAAGLPDGFPAEVLDALSVDQLADLRRRLADFVEQHSEVDDIGCDSRRWETHDPDASVVTPLAAQGRDNLAHELQLAQERAAWLGRDLLLEEIVEPVLAAHGVEIGE